MHRFRNCFLIRIMTGVTENSETNKNQQQTVTSVGNAWVICDSKSRPGFKYYFNTFTGQAAWNLSLAEIEKAKKFTKGLPIAEIERCPEPTEPPMDSLIDPSQNTPVVPVFNEQIVNSQYHNQMSNVPNVYPLNLLNGIPGPFTPNVWVNPPNGPAIPPGAQVIYIPYQPPMNFQHPPEYSQNLHTTFQNNVPNRDHNINNRDHRLHNNWARSRFLQHQQSQKWHGSNGPDLRQKLIRKRSKSLSCDQESYEDYSYQDFNIKNKEAVSSANQHVNIMKEETRSKYDLSTLQELKPPHSKAGDNWFIVVDIEIILAHFPFLNKITDPDQNCYLVVPEHVMSELARRAWSESDMRTRRIHRFLSAQIDNELAFKGEDMEGIADSSTDKLFTTCEDLAMRNNNVILLSNDIRLYNFKSKNPNVHVLTMNELKMLLPAESAKRVPIRMQSPTLNIKIVIPNDRECGYNRDSASRQRNCETPEYEIPTCTIKNNANSIQSSIVPSSSKQTIDNIVQKGNPKNIGGVDFSIINKMVPSFSKQKTDNIVQKGNPKNIGGVDFPIINKTVPSFSKQKTDNIVQQGDPKNIDGVDFFIKNNIIPSSSKQKINNIVQKCNPKKIDSVDFSIIKKIIPSSSKQKIDNVVQKGDPKNIDGVEFSTININTSEPVRTEKRAEDSSFYKDTKKKEIKLTRSASTHSTSNEKTTQMKQYRWRKQRSGASKVHASISSSATSDQTVKENEPNTFSDSNPDRDMNEIISKPIFSPRAPSVNRSSLSSPSKTIIERPHIVIEETSTSGVISNTNDSESINSLSKEKKITSFSEDINYVMFEVVGSCMEEVLRTRREEWVLRFVQIMEEVLREKLRDNSPVQSKDYAAPWATDLPELARCIIKKYSDYFNVVDAANRLSFTLHRISDCKGMMRPNIEPSQFMDMYSYGVYLIETLKDVNSDCEDLSIADESLKKLLYDIQNANIDSMHNNTIVDALNESAEPIMPEKELPLPFVDSGSVKESNEENVSDTRSEKSGYRLRSRKKNPVPIQNHPYQSPIKNNPTGVVKEYFSAIELKKTLNADGTSFMKRLDFQDTPKTSTKSSTDVKSPDKVLSPSVPQASPKNRLKQSCQQKTSADGERVASGIMNTDNTDGVTEKASTAVQPSFVRHFTSIAQFEEKLINNSLVTDDYEDEGDYENEDYDGSAYPNEYYKQTDVAFDEIDLEDGEMLNFEDDINADEPAMEDASNKENLEESQMENNNKFKWFIAEFIGEMRESFEAVQKLCIEFVAELKKSPHESSPEMSTKLRAACTAMLSISNSLNSILDRESRIPDNNVRLLLKKANLEEFVPDEDLRLEYIDVISKCKDQAFTCYKTVALIMRGAGIRNVA